MCHVHNEKWKQTNNRRIVLPNQEKSERSEKKGNLQILVNTENGHQTIGDERKKIND